MKVLSTLIVLSIFCTDCVTPYVSYSPSGGASPWKDGAESSFAKTPANIELDDIFREEYYAWAKRYGKSTSDNERFENFKVNFMLQMQHNKKTGTFNILNEFGDMTEKEFESGNNQQTDENKVRNDDGHEAITVKSKEPTNNAVEVEVIVGEEPIPRVRMLDSATIPRVTPVGSPTRSDYATQRDRQRQRPNSSSQRVSLDASPVQSHHVGRKTVYASTARSPAFFSRDQPRDPSANQPRVRPQGQSIDQPPQPRRKRRLVRIGPDRIL